MDANNTSNTTSYQIKLTIPQAIVEHSLSKDEIEQEEFIVRGMKSILLKTKTKK